MPKTNIPRKRSLRPHCKTGKFLDCAYCGNSFYVQKCRLKRIGKRAPKYCSVSCRGYVASVRHGHARVGHKTLTYYSWKGMLARVRENADERHKRLYFDSGITVCDRWQTFENFLEDMGEKPEGHRISIERRDNTKGYFKDNCYWATQKEQNRNKRTNRMITFNGKTQCAMAWADESGLKEATIRCRLNRGWTITSTLTVPVQSVGARNPEWRKEQQ